MNLKLVVIPLSALALLSCGESSQNGANRQVDTTETVAALNQGEFKLLPELVFDDLKYVFSEGGGAVPVSLSDAKKIVIKGDEIRFWNGQKEVSCKIDLSAAKEEALPDSYHWHFSTIKNPSVPGFSFDIVSEYEEACVVRNLNPKERRISLVFERWEIIQNPEKFTSWDNLKRGITQDYPSDEEYQQVLSYVNREEGEVPPEDFEEGNSTSASSLAIDDLKKIVKIIDESLDPDKFVFKGNSGSYVYEDNGSRYERKFYCYPFATGGWMVYAPVESVSDKGHRFSSLAFRGYKDGAAILVDASLELVDDAEGKGFVKEVYSFSDEGVTITRATDASGKSTVTSQYRWNGQFMEKK